jgi:hypothetical protein
MGFIIFMIGLIIGLLSGVSIICLLNAGKDED